MNTDRHFLDAIEFIEELCGIALDDSKEYLVQARFADLVERFHVPNVGELVQKAKHVNGEPIRKAIVEAITTRETQFFRDPCVFETLRKTIVPNLIAHKKATGSNRIRIWSAAASSGQEACSIAMTLLEVIKDPSQWNIQIVGTDISSDALTKAKAGIYSRWEVERGLAPQFLKNYMVPHPQGFSVVPEISRLLSYKELNLLQRFPFHEPFDFIFCRNVAIYFNKSVKVRLFRRMLPLLDPDGYLFVGVSESLLDCGPEFRPFTDQRTTYYRPNFVANVKIGHGATEKGVTALSSQPVQIHSKESPVGSLESGRTSISSTRARVANPIHVGRVVTGLVPSSTIQTGVVSSGIVKPASAQLPKVTDNDDSILDRKKKRRK